MASSSLPERLASCQWVSAEAAFTASAPASFGVHFRVSGSKAAQAVTVAVLAGVTSPFVWLYPATSAIRTQGLLINYESSALA